MKSDKTIEKPLALEIAEAEEETIQAVNSIMRRHKLPYTLYEPIIAGVYRQLIDGKKNEIADASARYEASIKETERNRSDVDCSDKSDA